MFCKRSCFFVSLLLAVLLLAGCRPTHSRDPEVKDGTQYCAVDGIFIEKWWLYYERALSCAEGGFLAEAEEDLQKAIIQRDKDQRRARTSGMHFIDYFPHRELGIVYYQTENMKEAEKELELSLGQFPSAKARFYLDRVRKFLIEEDGKKITPPELTLKFENWTRKDPVIISGDANDDKYIASVSIDKNPLFLEGSKKYVHFEKPLSLPQGKHTIEVKAKNLTGKAVVRQAVIHVDRQGPVITLDELKIDDTGGEDILIISGSLYDEAGISEFFINEQKIFIQESMKIPGKRIPFSKSLKLDGKELKLTASDRLANETFSSVPLSLFSADHEAPLFACTTLSAAEGFSIPREASLPYIQIDLTEKQTVYRGKVYAQIQAYSDATIESLNIEIRDKEGKIHKEPTDCRQPGNIIIFNHIFEFQSGENKVVIEAKDKDGKYNSEEIIIIRKEPKALELRERLILCISPFEYDKVFSKFQRHVRRALSREVFLVWGDRKRRFGISDDEGKAHYIISGWIKRLPLIEVRDRPVRIEGRLFEVVCKITDRVSKDIIYVEMCDDRRVKTENFFVEGITNKIHRKFPFLDGMVRSYDEEENMIATDLKHAELRPGLKLVVYREESSEADQRILGHAGVTKLKRHGAEAKLDKNCCKEPIKDKEDKVITQ